MANWTVSVKRAKDRLNSDQAQELMDYISAKIASGESVTTYGEEIGNLYFFNNYYSSREMEKVYDELVKKFPQLDIEEYCNNGPSPQMELGNRSTSKSINRYRKHTGAVEIN